MKTLNINMTSEETSEYLSSIFDSSPVALIALDTGLRIILFNRTASLLTGYGKEEITGSRITKVLPFESVREIIRALRNRAIMSMEGYVVGLSSKEGDAIPVRLKISPLLDSDDGFIGVLLLASDLREIKKIQSKLLEAERLAAITETAISVNHEINNPLCSILGNTQMLLMEKDSLDANMVVKLHNIEQQITRIQSIARKLGKITKPVLKEYVGGKKMLDVEASQAESPPEKSKK